MGHRTLSNPRPVLLLQLHELSQFLFILGLLYSTIYVLRFSILPFSSFFPSFSPFIFPLPWTSPLPFPPSPSPHTHTHTKPFRSLGWLTLKDFKLLSSVINFNKVVYPLWEFLLPIFTKVVQWVNLVLESLFACWSRVVVLECIYKGAHLLFTARGRVYHFLIPVLCFVLSRSLCQSNQWQRVKFVKQKST